MKRIIFLLALCASAGTLTTLAQSPEKSMPSIEVVSCEENGGEVVITGKVDMENAKLNRRGMLLLTPVLREYGGGHQQAFRPIAIAGAMRYKVIRRARHFGDYAPDPEPAHFIRYRKRDNGVLHFTLNAPFEKWMRDSELIFVEEYAECRNLVREQTARRSGVKMVFPEPYYPAFEVSYVEPPAEEVKIQSNTYSAMLGFQPGKSQLMRDFGDNARILDEADRIIDAIKNDTLITIRRISVRGYASPEGGEALNMRLSRERAQAFVGYIHWKHNFYDADRVIVSYGMGEDWDGLHEAVGKSDLPDRDKVLTAIETMDVGKRKSYIRGLSGGRTYRRLLEDFYPALRRNEYTVEYLVRGFTPEEAAVLIRTNPRYLSLNEMFLASKLYDRDSEEFKEIFDVAARIYPDSPIAQLNTAAMEIENGSYDKAIKRLEGMELPQAWNNLGVAYWHKGWYEKALEMFNKSGDLHNIEEYLKWNADRSETE